MKNAKSNNKRESKKVSLHKERKEGSKKDEGENEENLSKINEGNGNGDAQGHVVTEKEKLLALYQTLKDLGINSIGDLEVKISRL